MKFTNYKTRHFIKLCHNTIYVSGIGFVKQTPEITEIMPRYGTLAMWDVKK